MWPQEFIWFFAIFHQEFRKGNRIAFEVLMMLAFAHFFGFYNPKQLADFLGIPHQKFYAELKDWSLYHVKKMLLRFMVKQGIEHLQPVLNKSAATQSRAGMTLSIDQQFPLLTWSPPLHLNKTLCGWLTPPSRSKRVGILAKMPAIGCQEVTLFVL